MQAVCWQTFDWDRTPIRCHTSNGIEYVRRAVSGVPRIPDDFLRSVFYLYPDEASAEAGEDCGGTGFISAIPCTHPFLTEHHHFYAVTNNHVACRDGCSVIRFNLHDGGTTILVHDPSDWETDALSDIAVLPLDIDPYEHQFHFLGQGFFLKEKEVADLDVGIGEDAFMIGRFIDHDGKELNRPSVRFGHISMMASEMLRPEGLRLSFSLDMKSRTGYSGSPVVIYRTPGSNLARMVKTGEFDTALGFLRLLGIHWGSFDEPLTARMQNVELDVRGFSTMTCVSPAWKITEVLMRDKFVKQREEDEEEAARELQKQGAPAREESAAGGGRRDGFDGR